MCICVLCPLQLPVECVQRSGQLLYVPSAWSHSTINLDDVIGLAIEFDEHGSVPC